MCPLINTHTLSNVSINPATTSEKRLVFISSGCPHLACEQMLPHAERAARFTGKTCLTPRLSVHDPEITPNLLLYHFPLGGAVRGTRYISHDHRASQGLPTPLVHWATIALELGPSGTLQEGTGTMEGGGTRNCGGGGEGLWHDREMIQKEDERLQQMHKLALCGLWSTGFCFPIFQFMKPNNTGRKSKENYQSLLLNRLK